jgi:hypothetical protein
MKRSFLVAILIASFSRGVFALDDPLFHSTDSLAGRDEWGKLHQSAGVNETDFERRYRWRPFYYLESRKSLKDHPEYIAALETELRRRGYYCGEIDGIFGPELSDAIARMQKNYSMRVTGTITPPVRRALYLP